MTAQCECGAVVKSCLILCEQHRKTSSNQKMSIALSVYFSESLERIIIVIKSPKPLTSLLASLHCMAFVIFSFHVAEIINLALLRLADTSMYMYYIINPVVSPDWTLRQNLLVGK